MFQRSLGATRRTLDALVRQIAELSVDTVCRLVENRVAAMSLCEARGYTRARAATEIRRQVRAAISERSDLDPTWEQAIIVRATDRVAPLVLRQLAAARARSTEQRLFGAAPERRAA